MSSETARDRSQELVAEAWKILRTAGGDPETLCALAKALQGEGKFGLARRLLGRAREGRADSAALSLELRQQHALCTYKDPDLPRHVALRRALEILDLEGDLVKTVNQETLGIAGGIYKRKWEVGGRKAHLERALAYYYERGHFPAAEHRRAEIAGGQMEEPQEIDRERVLQGYTSINAAYVLDLLASIEEDEARAGGFESRIAADRRAQARDVRQEIVDSLSALMSAGKLRPSWWSLTTVAEAQFGLGLYDDAARSLEKAAQHDNEPWMFESTARQLVSLMNLIPAAEGTTEPLEESPAWRTVEGLLDLDTDAVRSLFHGKLGLALSGGGFRASFFHIGVLARLAELDLLRHVEVLSCVSGGSIVGAHYYLEVRKLLMEKWDRWGSAPDGATAGEAATEEAIDRQDYIKTVEKLAESFLDGVERNLRMRAMGSVVANLKMALLPSYSRTDRFGELYERELYAKVDDGGGARRYMDELLILPKGKERFHPKSDNWRRRHKVPTLVLNATSLNTGHNWQFTGTWMGESPFSIDQEVDGNWRLRRMWYSEAPDLYRSPRGKRRVRLGTAVGASACVPGLFEPVALPALYPKEPIAGESGDLTLRLVDGGVHDNQGVASLLEQDCTVLIVSDASGQMTSQIDPGGGVLAPLLRTNSVLMERVRQAQFQDLKARLRTGLLKGLMVVHLKKGLGVDPIDWKECEEPPDTPLRRTGELLDYGILSRMQKRLAAVRTDLDSFTEVEAYGLMTSGYLMAARYARDLRGFPMTPVAEGRRHEWVFLRMEEPLSTRGEGGGVQSRVERMLAVASQGSFKIWRLSGPLTGLARLLGVGVVAGFLWLWVTQPALILFDILPPNGFAMTISGLGWSAVFTGLAVVLGRVLGPSLGHAAMKAIGWRSTLSRLARGVAMALGGWLVAATHIRVFDRAFLAQGRLARVFAGRGPEGRERR